MINTKVTYLVELTQEEMDIVLSALRFHTSGDDEGCSTDLLLEKISQSLAAAIESLQGRLHIQKPRNK